MKAHQNLTIVFIPFFGGKKASLKRHFNFVENLGFNWVFIDLNFDLLNFVIRPYSANSFSFGMKKIWADQIEKKLNEIPGKKIVYAFSNPSAAAIEAISRRNGYDILGLICEGGPSGELYRSILNYYTTEKPLPTFALKVIASLISTHMIVPKPNEICFTDLKKFPLHIPILSIRGWKDPLISPQQIDKIFEPHSHLNWKKLSIPEAAHLNGLKDFKTQYENPVSEFLLSVSKPNDMLINSDEHP